jgi:hypothetical protein
MTPAVPKVSTCTVNVEALIRNPRSGISSGCGGGASQCVARREITVLAGCGRTVVELGSQFALAMAPDIDLASLPSDSEATFGYAELYPLWKADEEAFNRGQRVTIRATCCDTSDPRPGCHVR